MDAATRIGIGGIGIAAIFGLLPFVPGISVPPAIVYSGIAVGVLIAAWGLWPVAASFGLGNLSLWRIPLLKAMQICYEKCEGTFVGAWVDGMFETRRTLFVMPDSVWPLATRKGGDIG